jgi:hypothetical protein
MEYLLMKVRNIVYVLFMEDFGGEKTRHSKKFKK